MRSQPYRPTLRTNDDCLALAADIADGSAAARDAACATLRREVGDYVECFANLPVSWLDESEPARRTIAQRVLQRLEADDHRVIREWRARTQSGCDKASFWSLVKTLVCYVTVTFANSADRGTAATTCARRRR